MKIIVDCFGGDNAPQEVVLGTLKALSMDKNVKVVLVGNQAVVEELVGDSPFKDRIEFVNALEVITCEEEPTVAIKQKKDSSIVKALECLKTDEEAVALVSAGSTGAVLVGATLKIGRIKGISRPCLCPVLPTIDKNKKVILLDCGANADCKALNLVHFAVMGASYSEKVLGVKNPKVALLSNGNEDAKGNMLVHETFEMLNSIEGLNFVGNREARDLLTGEIDVMVTDGFSGNVCLKASEGALSMVMKMLKRTFMTNAKTKIGALLVKKELGKMKYETDYNNYGGAVFIGAKKLIIKSHGSSKQEAFCNSILQAVKASENSVNEEIQNKLVELNIDKFKVGL